MKSNSESLLLYGYPAADVDSVYDSRYDRPDDRDQDPVPAVDLAAKTKPESLKSVSPSKVKPRYQSGVTTRKPAL